MNDYICQDCEHKFDKPVRLLTGKRRRCPNCLSEDIIPFAEYLNNEAENKKDDETEDRLLWVKK